MQESGILVDAVGADSERHASMALPCRLGDAPSTEDRRASRQRDAVVALPLPLPLPLFEMMRMHTATTARRLGPDDREIVSS